MTKNIGNLKIIIVFSAVIFSIKLNAQNNIIAIWESPNKEKQIIGIIEKLQINQIDKNQSLYISLKENCGDSFNLFRIQEKSDLGKLVFKNIFTDSTIEIKLWNFDASQGKAGAANIYLVPQSIGLLIRDRHIDYLLRDIFTINQIECWIKNNIKK